MQKADSTRTLQQQLSSISFRILNRNGGRQVVACSIDVFGEWHTIEGRRGVQKSWVHKMAENMWKFQRPYQNLVPQLMNSNRNYLAVLRVTGSEKQAKLVWSFQLVKNGDSFRWPDLRILTPNSNIFNLLLIGRDVTSIKDLIIKEHQSRCLHDILYCQWCPSKCKRGKKNKSCF